MKKIILVFILFISVFVFICCNKSTLIDIDVTNYIEFDVNDVDVTKINITLKYDNNKTKVVKASNNNFNSLDTLKNIGIHKLSLNYEGFTKDIYISIKGELFNITILNNEDLVVFNNNYSSATILTEPYVNQIEGYNFIGWVDQFGELFDFSKEVSSNLLLYPKYEIKKYKIKFFVEEDLYSEVEVEHGNTISSIPTPKKDDYMFMGWNIELANKPIYEDYNLYAKFKRINDEVYITYYVNDEVFFKQTVKYGTIPEPIDTSSIEGFVSWDADLNIQLFEDTTVHAIINDKCKVVFQINDDILELEVPYNTLIEPVDFSNFSDNYNIEWQYDFSKPIINDTKIDGKLIIKVEYAFNYIKDAFVPVLYGNKDSKVYNTTYYDNFGFSGYSLVNNDKVLFVSNVYIINNKQDDYFDEVLNPSAGTLYINNSGQNLLVKLDQIRASKREDYHLVACNELGYVKSIVNNLTETEVYIPKGGFLWSPGFNDGTNGNNSLIADFRSIENCERLICVDWSKYYEVTYQTSDGIIIAIHDNFPGIPIEYPSLPTIDGYEFLRWDNENKNLFFNTVLTAIYIPENAKEVEVTVINGSGSGTYVTGENIRLIAEKKSNKEFSYWICNGEKISTNETVDVLVIEEATYVAHYVDKTENVNLVVNGNTITYRNSTSIVTLPNALTDNLYGMRAAWVSAITGCVAKFQNEAQYKANVMEMFDVLERYNFNAVMFHIRIYNDAYYPSKLNPKSSNMNTDLDMLKWTIDECHKRGIEFHAWMNPYRVKTSGGTDLKSVANSIKAKCPANIGSDPNNLLGNSSGAVILNPGLPEVRKFLVDTCMEVVTNYDVDAIHFDDYFYIDGVDDSSTRQKYNKENLSIADFRRKQVDTFISDLSIAVRQYNSQNHKFVQIGISPSGIWRNGNGIVTYDEYGNAITNGSKTGGMEHYAGYLFSDTVNWINHEWIDYIMPQTYWAFTHKTAPYADLMEWWSNVVRYKNVKLYSGIGIYMADGGGNYSWGTNPSELLQQLTYISKFDNVGGCCLFKFQYLRNYYNGKYSQYFNPMFDTLFKDNWHHQSLCPEVTSANGKEILNAVNNLVVTNDGDNVTISFDSMFNARKYAIFRTDGINDFTADELVKVIGMRDGKIELTDTLPYHGSFTYYVYAISGSNTLGTPKKVTIKY